MLWVRPMWLAPCTVASEGMETNPLARAVISRSNERAVIILAVGSLDLKNNYYFVKWNLKSNYYHWELFKWGGGEREKSTNQKYADREIKRRGRSELEYFLKYGIYYIGYRFNEMKKDFTRRLVRADTTTYCHYYKDFKIIINFNYCTKK